MKLSNCSHILPLGNICKVFQNRVPAIKMIINFASYKIFHFTKRTSVLPSSVLQVYYLTSVTEEGMYSDFVQKHGLLMEETVYQGSCRTWHINSNMISRKSFIDTIQTNMNVQWTKTKTDTCSRCDKFRSGSMYQRGLKN